MKSDIRIVVSVTFQGIYTVVTGELMLLLKWQSRKSQRLCRYLKHVMHGVSRLWKYIRHQNIIFFNGIVFVVTYGVSQRPICRTSAEQKSLMAIVFGSVYTQNRYHEWVMLLGQQALCSFCPYHGAGHGHATTALLIKTTRHLRGEVLYGKHKGEMCYSQSVLGIMRTVLQSRHTVYGWA